MHISAWTFFLMQVLFILPEDAPSVGVVVNLDQVAFLTGLAKAGGRDFLVQESLMSV